MLAAQSEGDEAEEAEENEREEELDVQAKLRLARAELEEEGYKDRRLDWLRSQGIHVDVPDGRLTGVAPHHRSSPKTFRYVFLPADESKPPEEREATMGPGDVLPGIIRPCFRSGTVSDDVLMRMSRQHLEPEGQQVSLDSLRQAVATGGADSLRLAAPSEDNGYEAVFAYLDDCAELKGLSQNTRASALAQTCGFPSCCELLGDVFLGRVRMAPEAVHNVDFCLVDLQPGCVWQKRAPLENHRAQKAEMPEEHAAAQERALQTPEFISSEACGYCWQDSLEDVEVTVKAPGARDAGAKSVHVTFTTKQVRVTQPVELKLNLYALVDAPSCSWSFCSDGILLVLAKQREEQWPQLTSI